MAEESYDWKYSRQAGRQIAPWIRVECSGVGYEIEVPMSTLYNLPEVNNEVFLLTHMVVR